MIFVACSALLVALISIVAWSFYSSVVATTAPTQHVILTPQQHLMTNKNSIPSEVEKSQEAEFFDEQWNTEDSYHSRRPSFVTSDSSELNFDELENGNSVNSALMHPAQSDEIVTNTDENVISRDTLQGMPPLSNSAPQNPQITRDFGDYPTTQMTGGGDRTQKFFDLQSKSEVDAQLIGSVFNQQQPQQQQQQSIQQDSQGIDVKGPTQKPRKPTPEDGEQNKPPSSGNSDSTNNNQHSPMTLYRLEKAAKAGAVCLDGSSPAYYHRPGIGPNERSWIIHFNGGAWCFDANACVERSHGSLGSTKKLPKSPPIIQGINSPNPVVNPDFYDWNLVWVVYCDGASFTGNRDKPIVSKSGQTIYMRGKRVLNAIVNDLLYNRDFKGSESVILTGSSAGSMAAIFQADFIASKFLPSVPVRVLVDAGFFIDTSPIGGKNLQVAFKKVFEMQNATTGLNQACVRAMKLEPWKCYLPAIASLYVKTPMYVLNSAYDIWALIYFLGIDCKFPATGEKVQRRRRQIRRQVDHSKVENEMLEHQYQKQNFLHSDLSKKDVSEHTISHHRYSPQYPKLNRRDVSGFEMRPFFRSYIEHAHHSIKSAISKFASSKGNLLPFRRKSSEIANSTTPLIHLVGNHTFVSAIHNETQSNPIDQHQVNKANSTVGLAEKEPSLLTITSTNTTAVVTNATAAKLVESSAGIEAVSLKGTRKTDIGANTSKGKKQEAVDYSSKKLITKIRNSNESIENTIPMQMNILHHQHSADGKTSELSHRTLSNQVVSMDVRKSDNTLSSHQHMGSIVLDAFEKPDENSPLRILKDLPKESSTMKDNFTFSESRNSSARNTNDAGNTITNGAAGSPDDKFTDVNNSSSSNLLNITSSTLVGKEQTEQGGSAVNSKGKFENLKFRDIAKTKDNHQLSKIRNNHNESDILGHNISSRFSPVLLNINRTNIVDSKEGDSQDHKIVKKHHVLKQRRSASIAREYINILRSDPPECTAGEINKALLYRDAILKATSGSLSPESGRFLVSCFDHSMSLFDETWNGIKINGRSIQQAFGDWFFNRVPRDKSNLIDCVFPCNLSCP